MTAMLFRGALVAGSLLAGCVDPGSISCGDRVCPSGTSCVTLTAPDELICATAEQVAACATVPEGEACALKDASGWCHDGVCLSIVCGNARVDRGEACDDGNTATGDGTCSGDCASDEKCGNGVVDPLRIDSDGVRTTNEQCDDGNLASNDGCSSTCRAEQPHWAQLDARPLPPLFGHALAYDSARDRVVLFGGTSSSSPVSPSNLTFEWDGAAWSAVPADIAPPARFHHAMAYDAARRRIVLFGGQSAQDDKVTLGDTWEFDGDRWEFRALTVSPATRSKAAMVYDSKRKKIVLFGGIGSANGLSEQFLDDTWEYDGSWTKIEPATKPTPRMTHGMVYDPSRGVTVVFAGDDDNAHGQRRDTWEYDGTTWRNANAPTPDGSDVLVLGAYDPVNARVIMFGGRTASSSTIKDQTYAYNGTSWTSLGQTQPGMLEGAGAVADPRRGQIILFGGRDDTGTVSGVTWAWNGSQWTQPAVAARPPPLRLAAVATDTKRGVTWVFGGDVEGVGSTNEMWSYDTAWKSHGTTGPGPRVFVGMAYDRARDRVVMFGGTDTMSGLSSANAETWLWDGTQWTMASPMHVPPVRVAPAMTYDPVRERVVMVGGFGASVTVLDDIWEWDGSDWHEVTPPTAPSGRGGASIVFDHARGNSVLFGGFVISTTQVEALGDTWTWDGATWTDTSTPLRSRIFSPAVEHRGRQRVWTFGGDDGAGGALYDLWEWNGTSWQQLFAPIHPDGRAGHVAFVSRDGASMIVTGGADSTSDTGVFDTTTWRLRFESDEPRELCSVADADNDNDGLTGCADPDCWATCTPSCPPSTSCDPAAPRCGDGTCSAVESCRACAADCGACVAVCGDTFCDDGETATSCPGDC